MDEGTIQPEKQSPEEFVEYILDGTKMLDRKSGLQEVYEQLGFHDYINYANLDGLYELLSVSYWEGSNRVKIHLRNSSTLIDNDPIFATKLLAVFEITENDWKKVDGYTLHFSKD